MHTITIKNDEGGWPELQAKIGTDKLIDLTGNGVRPWEVARIPQGTKGGKSSVILRIDLADGRTIVAETTMALLLASAAGLRGAEERDGIFND